MVRDEWQNARPPCRQHRHRATGRGAERHERTAYVGRAHAGRAHLANEIGACLTEPCPQRHVHDHVMLIVNLKWVPFARGSDARVKRHVLRLQAHEWVQLRGHAWPPCAMAVSLAAL